MFQKMLAESLYKKYDLNEAFTNGTLAEFNPEDLMNKVMNTGQSLHTIRTFKDKTYYITVFYSDWIGPKGIDDPNTKYWVDIVEEDKNRNQERIYLTSFEDKDMLSDEIVELLNNWKNEVLTSKRQTESYKKKNIITEGRRKVRNYPTVDEWKERIVSYMKSHKNELIDYMMYELGYDDIEELQEDDYHMRFGFDCGWVNLVPRNKEMAHEWYLDNDRIPDYLFDLAGEIYPTQSITIKRPIIEKAIKDMGLDKEFIVVERLD